MSGISRSIALPAVIPAKAGIQNASDQSGLAVSNNLDPGYSGMTGVCGSGVTDVCLTKRSG